MLIIHGDNIIQSRQKLVEILNQKKNNNFRLVRIEAIGLTRANLESQLWSSSLFAESRIIVLESLFSLPKSKKKDELIELLAAAHQDKNLNSQLVTWDGKTVTVSSLKKFPDSQILEFKTSPIVFKWLDLINGRQKNTKEIIKIGHQAFESDGAELCLALLTRQIRLLIQAIEKQPIAGPPFIIRKISQQAATFNLDQLLNIHTQLLKIDRELKTSSSVLSLDKKLDLLILKL